METVIDVIYTCKKHNISSNIRTLAPEASIKYINT